MKHFFRIISVGLFLTGLIACSKTKNELEPASTSSLNIVNLINGSNGVLTNFQGVGEKEDTTPLMYYTSAALIGFGTAMEFSSYTGSQPLTIVSSTDTVGSEWSGILNLPVGAVQSIYFFGQDTLHIDTLLTMDNIPYYPATDSVIGVRFINLAATPVLIDLQGTSDTVVTALPYKGVTGFSALSATSTNPSTGAYTFEFRDPSTGLFLASYTYSPLRVFKCVSIVLGATNSNGSTNYITMPVNDY
jgi:hypothetical protein